MKYRYEVRGSPRKRFVVRVWKDGYFPITPIKGLDVKDKNSVK